MDTQTARCPNGGLIGPAVGTIGNGQGPAAERREAPPAAALPCLLVTTQPELARGEGEDKAAQVNKLQGSHKCSAQCSSLDIIGLAKQFGLERLWFLTLTFVENVYDIREANRRFNSLNTHVISYIGKHVRARNEGDKGARLVRYIGYGVGDRTASPQFAWAYGNGWLWRHKLAAWASRHAARDASELSRIFGPRWAYALQAWILAEDLPDGLACPSFRGDNRFIDTCVPLWLARSQADKVKEGMTFNRCYDLDKDKLWTAKQASR